ncbi:hypothetical protein RBB50_001138 [Rhinocladiella similis]
MPTSKLSLTVAAALLGVISHANYFIRGEHHTTGWRILKLAALGSISVVAALVYFPKFSVRDAIGVVLTGLSLFSSGLFASMLMYRAFFHPLRHIPGPFNARLTKLWFGFNSASGKGYQKLKELHEIYGDVVRVGPNEVSIIIPKALELVHGPGSMCQKGGWYDVNLPRTSLHQMRDRKLHDRRRKSGWDKAFNSKSVKGYEKRVTKHTDKLLAYLSDQSGNPVDASKISLWYTWDIMGMLAFSRSFNNIESGKSHPLLDLMHTELKPLAFLSPIPWLAYLLNRLPPSLSPVNAFFVYCASCVKERRSIEPPEPDIYTYLLEGEKFFGKPDLDEALMEGDARLIVVAGSDTTASALATTIYHFARNPNIVESLRRELASHNLCSPADLLPDMLKALPYLNAIIDETLRIRPPVLGSVYRETPPEGLQVDDTYIPGAVTVLTPMYAIQTSPKAYVDPLEYVPERWTTQPELVLNKAAWFPFLLGPYGCIGKQVALMELRISIAKLVLAFDIQFAPGEDGTAFMTDTMDCFTQVLAPIEIIFAERKAQ